MSRDPHDAETKGVGGSLIDGFGRVQPTSGSPSPIAATSAAATACRPEGLPWMSQERGPLFEEIERLVRVLVDPGSGR